MALFSIQTVDSIGFYARQLELLNERVQDAQAELRHKYGLSVAPKQLETITEEAEDEGEEGAYTGLPYDVRALDVKKPRFLHATIGDEALSSLATRRTHGMPARTFHLSASSSSPLGVGYDYHARLEGREEQTRHKGRLECPMAPSVPRDSPFQGS